MNIDKKYIFKRKLDGKPIELYLRTDEDQRDMDERIISLFFETGVYKEIKHGKYACITTHDIRVYFADGSSQAVLAGRKLLRELKK